MLLCYANEVIASGRGYYENLTKMTEELHILRYAYKHHHSSMQKLFKDNYTDEAREYLAKLNANTIDDPLYDYCKSCVLLYEAVPKLSNQRLEFLEQLPQIYSFNYS